MDKTADITSLIGLIHSFLPQDDIDAQKLQPLLEHVELILYSGQRHRQTNWAAHMTPAVTAIAALGQLVAALHQGNMLSGDLYPELKKIETDIFEFFCPLFGQKTGHVTHGGSYGNLDALWQARKKYGHQSHTVYASDQSHYSIAKACDILGLDLQLIPSGPSQQMDLEALAIACQIKTPMAVVATAGTTSSGQLDDIDAIKSLLQLTPCWLHIDAAWGGFLSFIDNSLLTTKQLGQADSICFDPHKSLGQPRPCGLLMYQQPIKTTSSLTQYLTNTPRDSLSGSYGAELLLPLWLTIQTLEKSGMAQQIKTQLEQARQFADFINHQSGWWAQVSPTGIVCFTAPLQQDLSNLVEKAVFSLTEIAGKPVYRAVFASPEARSDALINDLESYL